MDLHGTNRWLVFEVAEQPYAIAVEHLRELVPLCDLDLHRPPELADFVEGVVWLRDHSVTVLDLRKLLGMRSVREETEEIISILNGREQDHLNWLAELEASVRERREFRLTTDPHKCKFGLWYDALMNDPNRLQRFANGHWGLIDAFERFNDPHRRIHEIGKQVAQLEASGQVEEAHRIIESTRNNELRSLRDLFEKCRQLVRRVRQGLLVVLEGAGDQFGVLVDVAQGVSRFQEEQFDRDFFARHACDFVIGVTKQEGSGRMVQLLDPDAIQAAVAAPVA